MKQIFAVSLAALAVTTIRPADFENKVKACAVVWKLFVELFDGIFRFHAPKLPEPAKVRAFSRTSFLRFFVPVRRTTCSELHAARPYSFRLRAYR